MEGTAEVRGHWGPRMKDGPSSTTKTLDPLYDFGLGRPYS